MATVRVSTQVTRPSRLLAPHRLAGADPEAIWQWAYIQRVANGLNMLRIGDNVESNKVLTGVAKLTTM
jgi:hypothetical protein